ncbi:MAG: lycopene cyclase domain-containing protein [Caldilineaceae bacterium]
MTYFAFLCTFIVPPILILAGVAWWDERRGRRLPEGLRGWPAWIVLLAHVVVAVLYTTPWDNYLVATQVWWYDPKLVAGWLIGWVPIEEYSFFVLQTILTSLWIWFLARRLRPPTSSVASPMAQRFRWAMFGFCSVLWGISLVLWLSHWHNIQYLSITLTWALLPVMLQFGFGGDILWKQRKLVFWSLLVPTLYLSLVDALAIDAGTWTIAPDQSTQLLIGSLPLEEGVFFFVTNLLIVLGTVLVLAKESQARAPALLQNLQGRLTDSSPAAHPDLKQT